MLSAATRHATRTATRHYARATAGQSRGDATAAAAAAAGGFDTQRSRDRTSRVSADAHPLAVRPMVACSAFASYHLVARCMTTVIQTTPGSSNVIGTPVSASASPAAAAPIVVEQPMKVVKEEPRVVYQPAPAARKSSGGGFRARLGGFVLGFVAASAGFAVYMLPIAEQMQRNVTELEARVQDLEASQHTHAASATPSARK